MSRLCPACNQQAASARGSVNGIDILRCQPCGTFYTSEVTVTDFCDEYESYYSEGNLSAPEFVGRSLDRIFSGFAPYRDTNRMLDVGFGGAFTMLAGVRAGWEVEGIEMSEPAVKNAHALGLRALHGDLHEVAYPSDHFDVVVCSEVLEHVPHPREMLAEIARILRPGGLLWATTPHGMGVSARLLRLQWSVMCPPEHLQLFSIRGLRYMFQETGFETREFVTENLNPFELVNYLRARVRGQVRTRQEFDRVHSNYELLDKVYSRRSLLMAKQAVHSVLHATKLGDSLKVWAVKTP